MEAAKTKFSVFSNFAYSTKMLWRSDKSLIFTLIIGTVVRVLRPFAGIITPRIVIDEITNGATPARFLAVMGIMAAVLLVLHYLWGHMSLRISQEVGSVAQMEYTKRLVKKLTTMDYVNAGHPVYQKIFVKGWRSNSHDAPSAVFLQSISRLAESIGGLILFGSVIALIHPIIIFLLALSVGINWLLQRWHRKYDEAHREAIGTIGRKRGHISNVLGNREFAKDLRMFSLTNWLLEREKHHTLEIREYDKESAKRAFISSLSDSFMILLRDGGSYAFLTYLLIAGSIGLGEFVMLFGAIGGMAYWINAIVSYSTQVARGSVEVSDRREALDYPDVSNTGKGVPVPVNAPEIRLENVTFTYPEAKSPALENINLTIKPGERLALVGINGAGKTTLIKLICGFFFPDKGNVICGGTNIREYNRDEYLSSITAVFQDIHLMPASISQNISLREPHETDNKRVQNCLEKAGLWEFIQSLEKCADTSLVRQVHDDAIELSGGQLQKLALARALYKEAPLLILDEPTAALDPIAENEMYAQYAALTKGKTSIYISHRLASTRFCDRVVLLDGKTIAEIGTHEELLANNGKYAEMYNIQASYYAENAESEVES